MFPVPIASHGHVRPTLSPAGPERSGGRRKALMAWAVMAGLSTGREMNYPAQAGFRFSLCRVFKGVLCLVSVSATATPLNTDTRPQKWKVGRVKVGGR